MRHDLSLRRIHTSLEESLAHSRLGRDADSDTFLQCWNINNTRPQPDGERRQLIFLEQTYRSNLGPSPPSPVSSSVNMKHEWLAACVPLVPGLGPVMPLTRLIGSYANAVLMSILSGIMGGGHRILSTFLHPKQSIHQPVVGVPPPVTIWGRGEGTVGTSLSVARSSVTHDPRPAPTPTCHHPPPLISFNPRPRPNLRS